MNCKPKDLAILIKPCMCWESATGEAAVSVRAGIVVRVVERCYETPGIDSWVLEEKLPFRVVFSSGVWARGFIWALLDEDLRPLPAVPADEVIALYAPELESA